MVHRLGLTLEYADLAHLEHDGDFQPSTGRLRLQEGLPHRIERSVLAHELAHVIYGDTPTPFGPVAWKQERRADEWAALRLISKEDYKLAELVRDGHAPAMAHDLDVSLDLVRAYQRVLLRTDVAVYVRPRMGLGQWDDRDRVTS
nr:ImmA/IrrE family metallo-endopeptidase [Microbacterium excoecariae]